MINNVGNQCQGYKTRKANETVHVSTQLAIKLTVYLLSKLISFIRLINLINSLILSKCGLYNLFIFPRAALTMREVAPWWLPGLNSGFRFICL